MASASDVPGLERLARRVPDDIRQELTPLELRLRCETAEALLDQADHHGDEVKADRLRAKAAATLRAISPGGRKLAMGAFELAMADANRDGDSRKAYQILSEIQAFERRNPEPDPERLRAAADAAAARLQIPPPTRSRLFNRMRGR